MRGRIWVISSVLAVAAVGSIASARQGTAPDLHGHAFACSERTLRGTYGIQMQGTRPVPPPMGGGFESVVGVVIRTYDGAGHFTQVDNIKGSITGLIPDRPGFGAYEVNEDCSAVTRFDPGVGILIEERMVIVDHGREFRSIVATPATIMVSAVGKRVGPR